MYIKYCHEITHMHTHKECHVLTLVRKGVMKDKGHPLCHYGPNSNQNYEILRFLPGLKRVEQEENISTYL